MTIDETRQPDDDELDAFLQGESALSHRLQRLSQPSVPADVSAAVLANIEAALAAEKAAAPAANDSVSPDAPGAGRLRSSSRWRMPLAFAASVLLGVMIHLQWRTSRAPAGIEAARHPPQVALELPSPETPPREDLPAAAAKSEPRPAAPTQAARPEKRGRAAPPAPVMVAQASIPVASEQTVVTTGIRASLQQSMTQKRTAAPAIEGVTAEDVGKMPEKNVADSLQRLPGVSVSDTGSKNPSALEQKREASGSIDMVVGDEDLPARRADAAPAPASAMAPPAPASGPPEEKTPEKAKAWLARIEKKIELGQDRDAVEEWDKFRKAYPDFEVPHELGEKIKALQQEPHPAGPEPRS